MTELILSFIADHLHIILTLATMGLTGLCILSIKEQITFLFEKIYSAHDIIGNVSKRQRELIDKIEGLHDRHQDLTKSFADLRETHQAYVNTIKKLSSTIDNALENNEHRDTDKA